MCRWMRVGKNKADVLMPKRRWYDCFIGKRRKKETTQICRKTYQVVQTKFELSSLEIINRNIQYHTFPHNLLKTNRLFCQAFSVGIDNV